jgi:hypothetical protein
MKYSYNTLLFSIKRLKEMLSKICECSVYSTGRMPSSGILHRVVLVKTDVSEKLIASIIKVTRIGELGKTLAVTSNQRSLGRNNSNNNKVIILKPSDSDGLKLQQVNVSAHVRFEVITAVTMKSVDF